MTRRISTQLIGKDELFKVLALGELTELPVLMRGTKGTAKTQLAIDYANSFQGKVFETQLSIGTRPSQIVGNLDIVSLMKGELKTISPIADADVVFIDEVDKASPEIRNSLLSVMRERKLFLGSEGVRDCKWKIMVGSCNIIPKDEIDSPFWDRWVIQVFVDRLPHNQYAEMWALKQGQVSKNLDIEIKFGDPANVNLLTKAAQILSGSLSDRTISYMPRIVQGIKGIWEMSDVQAIIKMTHFVAPHRVVEIVNNLTPKEYARALSIVDNLKRTTDPNVLTQLMSDLEKAIPAIKDVAMRQEIESQLPDIMTNVSQLTAGLRIKGGK